MHHARDGDKEGTVVGSNGAKFLAQVREASANLAGQTKQVHTNLLSKAEPALRSAHDQSYRLDADCSLEQGPSISSSLAIFKPNLAQSGANNGACRGLPKSKTGASHNLRRFQGMSVNYFRTA
jgi:hypothetical protein